MAEAKAESRRTEKIGNVISTKMQKTIVVEATWSGFVKAGR
jgi:ribosomal protein S17